MTDASVWQAFKVAKILCEHWASYSRAHSQQLSAAHYRAVPYFMVIHDAGAVPIAGANRLSAVRGTEAAPSIRRSTSHIAITH